MQVFSLSLCVPFLRDLGVGFLRGQELTIVESVLGPCNLGVSMTAEEMGVDLVSEVRLYLCVIF